jgi:hypothetical protein
MNKGYKINVLSKLIADEKVDESRPIFDYVKIFNEKDYGMRGSKIQPYTEQQQAVFIQNLDYEPLKQKKLDPVKHKIAYNKNLVITIQKHQEDFVVSFLNDHLQGALLFHSVGSGKTLTAVIFSHYYLTLKPDHNVVIISPPSLLFNFVEALKQYGLDIKDNRYTFETYEKFCKNPSDYVDNKTLLIIDEAHNFRTLIALQQNKKGRIITDACTKCDKVLAMTGTPFVNTPYDIENIMAMISKRGNSQLSPKDFEKLIEDEAVLKDYFNYRISYFNIMETDSKKYFPSVSSEYVPVRLKSGKYIRLISGCIKGNRGTFIEFDADDTIKYKRKELIQKLLTRKLYYDENDRSKFFEEDRDEGSLSAFYSISRQLGNFVANAKFKVIIKKIQDNPNFKTIIYSVFMNSCLLLLKQILEKNNIKFVDIDGAVETKRRQTNLNQYNDPQSGVNVLLISKAGTEGVSTFGTRQIFICESQFNPSSSEQAIARAIRFKSHFHLPENESHVQVYRLMICLDDTDEKICNLLTNGNIDARGAYIANSKRQKNKKTESFLESFLKHLEGITGKDNHATISLEDQFKPYMAGEIARQQEEHRNKRAGHRKKAPFSFNKPSESYMIDTIIRRREVTNKRILKTWDKIKKMEEDIRGLHSSSAATSAEGGSAEKLIESHSPDIRLENLSLIKKYKIDEIVHRMLLDDDTKVKQVEEFEDETTKHLKDSLRSGKDPKTIIKEQQDILNNRALSYLKYADKLNDMFVQKTFQAVQNKEGEALQEYYTPDEIADELMGYSEILTHVNSETHLRILEPSAGAGGLINAVIRARQQYNMNSGYTIEAIEFNNVSWELLKHVIEEKKMEEVIVLQEQRDFLKYVSNEQYDMIVMNPPFHLKKRFTGLTADMWDGDFVARGYALLKPGGEMLIIATSKMRDMTHNTLIKAKRKGLKQFAGFDLSNFVYPPDDAVEIVKEYKGKKWKPTHGGTGSESLTLTFTMYRITKPGGDNVEERKAKTKERKKEEKKEEKNERKKIEDELIKTLSTSNAPRRR